MSSPATGSTVSIHYTVTLADGQVIEYTTDQDPVEITLGSNQIMPGIERALMELGVGESTNVTIASGDAHGPRDDNLVQTLERATLPPELSEKLQLGMGLQSKGPNGEEIRLTVVELTTDDVTLDANHPLAGQDLSFEIQLISIS